MRVLYIEPFEGGSHAAFGRALRAALPEVDFTCVTLPARHWKWRMRGAAVWVAQQPELDGRYDLLFASSYLALGDLIALRTELAGTPRILYFHENQLAFPVRAEFSGERDHHYGFTQMVAASCASAAWFNSRHNRDSFLDAGAALLAKMPDARPDGWIDGLRDKSRVMPLPLELDDHPVDLAADRGLGGGGGPLIVWNHRWEHDKGPEIFFAALESLRTAGHPFRVAVCGHRFRRVPEAFVEAEARLRADPRVTIEQWGPVAERSDYLALLRRASIAVSSAHHEFFGISMLEATHAGARPLVPDALAYPERFPAAYRYPRGALGAVLSELVQAWHAGEALRANRRELTEGLRLDVLGPRYRSAFAELVGGAESEL